MRPVSTFFLIVLASGCGSSQPTMVHGKPLAHWLQALRDRDSRVRSKATEVLGNVGAVDAAVVPALIGSVKDRDVKVRRGAVVALLKIGPKAEQAMAVLEEAKQDEDAKVREYAAKALEAIGTGR